MAKFKSKGAIIYYGTANPPTTLIGQMGDSTFDLGEREGLIDVTTHDDTTGVAAQIDNGFKAPASLSGEIIWDPVDTTHELIRSHHDAGTAGFCKIVLPNTEAGTFIFAARVKSMSAPLPVKGKLACSITIEGTASTAYTA